MPGAQTGFEPVPLRACPLGSGRPGDLPRALSSELLDRFNESTA